MCTIAIEAPTPLYRTSRIKLYKNIARSRLFCRIAKRSIPKCPLIINLSIYTSFVDTGALSVEKLILRVQICRHHQARAVAFWHKQIPGAHQNYCRYTTPRHFTLRCLNSFSLTTAKPRWSGATPEWYSYRSWNTERSESNSS